MGDLDEKFAAITVLILTSPGTISAISMSSPPVQCWFVAAKGCTNDARLGQRVCLDHRVNPEIASQSEASNR
jgi:hypothetical protein